MQLTVLVGAPGAGKSTLLSHLHDAGPLIADMDEILEGGALLGVPVATDDAAGTWPTYNRLWVRIVAMMARSHVPVLLSAPVTPAEWSRAVDQVGGPQLSTRFLLLDCADDVRVQRLATRGWPAAKIGAAIDDAGELRSLGLQALDTTSRSVSDVGADVISMVLPPCGRAAV